MAGLLFESFEFREDGAGIQTVSAASTVTGYPTAMDRRILRVDKASDTTFYQAGTDVYGGVSWYDIYYGGRLVAASGFGAVAHGYPYYVASGISVQGRMSADYSSRCIAIPQALLKSPTPTELWITLDVRYTPTYLTTLDDPANLERSEARCQIFKWGDLSLRLRAITNPQPGPDRGDVVFGLYNGASLLGTVTVPNVNSIVSTTLFPAHWIYIKIHAKLDAVNGAFEVTCDGHNASYTGINTVATTSAASATHLYFSPGWLGRMSTTTGPVFSGCIDNIYIDDAGFPTGRPTAVWLTISGDHPDNQWTAAGTGATTVANALSGSGDGKVARGLGIGTRSFTHLLATARTGTGLVNSVLGVQYVLAGISNINLDDAKRLKAGIRVQPVGTIFGGRYPNFQPPATPSVIYPGKEDTSWLRSDSTAYAYDDFNGTNTGTQLVMEIVDPGPT